MAVFCPKKTSSPADRSSSREEFPPEPRLHCLILLLRKENVGYHVPALIKGKAIISQVPQRKWLVFVHASFCIIL